MVIHTYTIHAHTIRSYTIHSYTHTLIHHSLIHHRITASYFNNPEASADPTKFYKVSGLQVQPVQTVFQIHTLLDLL